MASKIVRRAAAIAALTTAAVCLSAVRPAAQDSASPASADAADRPSFEAWLADLRTEALARGIKADVVAAALDTVEPLPVVVERDQTQAEFTLTIGEYLKRRVTTKMVRNARTALTQHRSLLRRVQAAHRVEPATLVSIWGLESNFGRFTGVRPTVAALATLAYEPRRAAFFRQELFSALEILDRGDIDVSRLKGSWAGAMGQPQFMPSTYLKFAVDFDGDSRRDIWTTPADVFASIANYLTSHGWKAKERWGRRVRLPDSPEGNLEAALAPRTEGCRAARELSAPLPLDRWHRLGVRLENGRRLPASSLKASVLRKDGAAFLLYPNYEVLLAYNCAHPYALSVGLLADRLAGR